MRSILVVFLVIIMAEAGFEKLKPPKKGISAAKAYLKAMDPKSTDSHEKKESLILMNKIQEAIADYRCALGRSDCAPLLVSLYPANYLQYRY